MACGSANCRHSCTALFGHFPSVFTYFFMGVPIKKIKSCNLNLKISRLHQEFNYEAKEWSWKAKIPHFKNLLYGLNTPVIEFSEYLTELSSYIIGEEYVCCFCRKNQHHGRVSQLTGARLACELTSSKFSSFRSCDSFYPSLNQERQVFVILKLSCTHQSWQPWFCYSKLTLYKLS